MKRLHCGPVPNGTSTLWTVVTSAVLSSIALAARAADWPHWSGPARDHTSAEDSGFDRGAWPPKDAVWTGNVGAGGTSPLVVAGRVYVMGWRENRDTLYCLEAGTGREVWSKSYPCPEYGRHATGDEGLYSGVTSTPEYDAQTGLLYTLSTDGDLNCWDTAQGGRKVWGINLYDSFGAVQRKKIGRSGRRDYGYTSSPLVHGDWLIVEAGAPEGNLMAFDKRAGRRQWASQSKDQAGHNSGPVPITVEGVPCVAVLTLSHLLVARLDAGHEGQTIAEHRWETEFANNIATPAVHQNFVLITAGYNHDAICKLEIRLTGATKVWEQPFHSKVCSPAIHDGRVYWVFEKPYCLDFATGKLLWRGPSGFGDAGSSIITADNRWIIWAREGELVLAETAARAPDRYRELARKPKIGQADVWPHIVLSDGRLYCKDRQGNLSCYSLGHAASGKMLVKPTTPPTPQRPTVPEPKTVETTSSKPTAAIRPTDWPGNSPGLVLAWQRALGADSVLDATGKRNASWQLEPRGGARIGPRGNVELAGGAMLVRGADEAVLAACQEAGTVSVEVGMAAARANQTGPARIFTFSTNPFLRNFTLGQEGDLLLFRLRTPRTGDNGMNPESELCRVTAGKPYHVIVSYRPGELTCYVDGKKASENPAVQGDLSNWSAQHLLLGDEWEEARPWFGSIERFAIHSRFIEAEEARLRFELVRKEWERRGQTSRDSGNNQPRRP